MSLTEVRSLHLAIESNRYAAISEQQYQETVTKISQKEHPRTLDIA